MLHLVLQRRGPQLLHMAASTSEPPLHPCQTLSPQIWVLSKLFQQPEDLWGLASELNSCRIENRVPKTGCLVSSVKLETHSFLTRGGSKVPLTITGRNWLERSSARLPTEAEGTTPCPSGSIQQRPCLSLLLEMSATKPQDNISAFKPASCPAHHRVDKSEQSFKNRAQAGAQAQSPPFLKSF